MYSWVVSDYFVLADKYRIRLNNSTKIRAFYEFFMQATLFFQVVNTKTPKH